MDSLPELEPPELLTGQLIAERYRVEELLGEGGMGAVYRAVHVHMKKPVALKFLHRELTLNDEVRTRFEREAVASARIEHPHVTAATDFGKLPDGSCYLVLDYVSGVSLESVLATDLVLSPARAVHIVRQIASALEAAHTAGVIHRDLKPDNIMLVEHQGEADFVKVLDFGIAKIESRDTGHTIQLTQLGAVFGTPEYMSPEQAAGTKVDGRADLYTIGILLYEMLTGDTPFKGETIVAILTQHLTVEAPELPGHLPASLRRIVKKLLQKDPERRFQSARELLDALDAVEAPETARTIPAPALTSPSRAVSAISGLPGVTLWRTSVQPALTRLGRLPLSVGGRTFPVWQIALGCFAVGVVLAFLLWPSEAEEASLDAIPAGQTSVASNPKAAEAPDEPKLDLERARAGDPAVLQHIEALPPGKRGEAEWAALVVGYLRAENPKSSLAALDAALGTKPGVSDLEEVLAAAAALAIDGATSLTALDRIGKHFGARGADLLYEWSKRPPAGVDGKFGARVDAALAVAAENASPALRIALDLEATKTCSAIAELLPRAEKEADERSAPSLQKKTARRGCGLLNFQDCYPCLRGSGALEKALAAAIGRAGPDLVEPLRVEPRRSKEPTGKPSPSSE